MFDVPISQERPSQDGRDIATTPSKLLAVDFTFGLLKVDGLDSILWYFIISPNMLYY